MEYTFFWAGPFSQWFRSDFVVDGKKFCTAEQYMMYKKAIHFGDEEIAQKVMATCNPKIQKALGRKVKNFVAEEWNRVARQYVYEGNYAKFTQNPKLLKVLMETGDTVLVEASPYDTIWGIGMGADEASKTPPEKWKGTNWLGIEITRVRENLLQEQARMVYNISQIHTFIKE